MTICIFLLLFFRKSYLIQSYLSDNKEIPEHIKNTSVFRMLGNSIGVGLFLTLGIILSLVTYSLLPYLPVVGQLVAKIYNFAATTAGENTLKLLFMWWGWGWQLIFVFIPLIGPLIASALTFVPQNQLILILGYSITCAVMNLGTYEYDSESMGYQLKSSIRGTAPRPPQPPDANNDA